ncbi:helix-turn-helix domain-containing protein [bacterium]|nr:helix-turn-helix domain-containing protein [bacterium]
MTMKKHCRNKKIFPFLIILSLSARIVSASIPDTIPPEFKWTSPQPFSVITTNTIRLSVDAHDSDNGSGIAKAVFYAGYIDRNDRMVPKHPIGEVTNPPYEYMWNCSEIPDQNLRNLQLFCEVYDRAGNVAYKASDAYENSGPAVVLDRNPRINDSMLFSFRTERNIIIDGDLGEWEKKDSITFTNNDNIITAYSLWDKEKLYFGIIIGGRSAISHFGPGCENPVEMTFEDEIEIFLDPDHDHSPICSENVRHFLISAAGMILERRYHISDTYTTTVNIKPDVELKVTVNGTLNDDSDIDKNYTVELAIPWNDLGGKPRAGFSMGLELWNNDKDYVNGSWTCGGWTVTAANLQNPSEWGSLVFVDDLHPYAWLIYVLVAAAFCGVSGYGVFTIKKKYRQKEYREPVIESEFVIKARRYIDEHYGEETLSREDIAGHVGLAPSYFGKQFKKETGYNLSDYLTNVRIEKSKELLSNTRRKISEIAFDVGFNSQSYFAYMFKKKIRMSPKEYRLRTRKEG